MYSQKPTYQITQSAACNRHHSIQQRYARWLLTAFDHVFPSRDLQVTQKFIAALLGVYREGVTAVAQRLQTDNAIR